MIQALHVTGYEKYFNDNLKIKLDDLQLKYGIEIISIKYAVIDIPNDSPYYSALIVYKTKSNHDH